MKPMRFKESEKVKMIYFKILEDNTIFADLYCKL